MGIAQRAAELRREVERIERLIGIADTPELLGISQRARGDHIQPIALRHRHLRQDRERLDLRQKAAALVYDDSSVGAVTMRVSML
jgi:hypothetical protein